MRQVLFFGIRGKNGFVRQVLFFCIREKNGIRANVC